jgi:succinyl-CoA synthetase beta subunit
MNLLEYQSKEILASLGIPIPIGKVINSFSEAIQHADKLNFPVALKAQIPSGKRGKAGGILFAGTRKRLLEGTKELLQSSINNYQVKSLLIEEKINIAEEFYIGMTINPRQRKVILMFSVNGGMDIEEVARSVPESIFSIELDGTVPLKKYQIINLLKNSGINGNLLISLSQIIKKVENVFFNNDATTVEINPLAITQKGEIIALDAKIVIDDAALFRRKNLEKFKEDKSSLLERRAEESNLSFVKLEKGNIGIIAGGAGLALCTMDTVNSLGGKPMNFLDLGGGVSRESMANAVRIVASIPGVKGIIINAFGGINNCEIMAKGIVDVLEDKDVKLPRIVVKMRGHNQEEGWSLLEKHNIDLVKLGTTGEAVDKLLKSLT